MDVKVDEIEMEVKMADIPQTGDHTPESTFKTPKEKAQDSRDTNNTPPELPASVVLLEDVPTALDVPDYTSDTTIMDENMYDSDSTITDPDMADYLLAIQDHDNPDIQDTDNPDMQNAIDNPAMQNAVLSAVRNTDNSTIQNTVNHAMQNTIHPAMQNTIHPAMQNTGVNLAMRNIVNFAIQNAINPTFNPAIQNTIRPIVQNTINSTMQDAVNPATAFGALVEPPEPYESALPDAGESDNDTTMSEAAEEADQLRSSPCSTEISNRIRVHNPMSISWIVHPRNTEPNQSSSAIIDPAPGLRNAADSSIAGSRAQSRPAELPIVQSLIQAYIRT
jgi:hypothetical protein